MDIRELRWLFVVVLVGTFILGSVSEPATFGISLQWTNDDYRFAGGTHPVALTLAVIVATLYLLLMFAPPAALGQPLHGVFRRFLTFWLDLALAMVLITPVIGILPALTEWRRTGSFQWNFERMSHAPGDGWLALAVAGFVIWGLVLYFAFPLLRRKPTPGACITGYQIVPDAEKTMTFWLAILRTLLGFIALCAWYLAPFIARDRKNGKFWLDAVFGTRARKFT
jgi:RDD family protein